MNKTRSWLLVAALVLGAGGSAHAQAACPASAADRITISGVNLNDNANYEIYFGTVGGVLKAGVRRNAVCLVGPIKSVLKGGVAIAGGSLPGGTNNLCLGGTTSDNAITFLTSNLTVCGTPMSAMNYGGNTLSTYGGSAHDRTFGGLGRDIQNGNSNSDNLSSNGGTFDQLFGGTGNDQIFHTNGTFTWCTGNSGNDIIQDTFGNQDTLEGGDGDDLINSGCNNAIITCGNHNDQIWHPAHIPFDGVADPTGCETDNHTAGC